MKRPRWFVTTLVLLAAAACRRQTEVSRLKEFNVVVINIDALRADHLGCYGYGRPTSPFIDRLATEGVVFERALSNSSYTRESVAALESGLLPSCSGGVGWTARPLADRHHLGVLFQRAHYRTGFISATTMLTDTAFTAGFTYVRQLAQRWGQSGLGPGLSAAALEFVRQHADERFMMYLHYLDPHGPYQPPDELYRRFATIPFEHPVDLYSDVRPHFETFVKQGFGPGDPRFEDMVLRYDAEIADTDRSIEILFKGLDSTRVLDRTFVILTADHGEEFLDHGFIEHAWTVYDESLHVPLILWAPRALRPRRVAAPVSVIDVLPTILQLTQIPHDPQDFDGRALLDDHGDVVVPVHPHTAELLIQERNVVRAVVAGGWKYIAAQRWLVPGERPRAAAEEDSLRSRGGARVDLSGPVVHEELYHVADDPQERRDLVAAAPEPLRRLRERMRATLDACAQRRGDRGRGALQAEPPSPADAERLRSLGYLNE